jgi:hypothetical protein
MATTDSTANRVVNIVLLVLGLIGVALVCAHLYTTLAPQEAGERSLIEKTFTSLTDRGRPR